MESCKNKGLSTEPGRGMGGRRVETYSDGNTYLESLYADSDFDAAQLSQFMRTPGNP